MSRFVSSSHPEPGERAEPTRPPARSNPPPISRMSAAERERARAHVAKARAILRGEAKA